MRSRHRVSLVILGVCVGAGFAVAQTPRVVRPGAGPQTYGTSAGSVVSIAATEFLPIDVTFAYTSDVNAGARWSTNTSRPDTFSAALHLPGGAKVVGLTFDPIDIDPSSSVFTSLVECDAFSQNCILHPIAGAGDPDCLTPGFICSGNAFAGGEVSIGVGFGSADAITIDNATHTYRLIAGNGSGNANTKIGGVLVSYVLQVSPPPGFVTFNDVPTSHPFFQYIQALAASGITGGCNASPPLYCPNNPVTRGQMAVFLAKALGLQFP